MSDLLVVTSSTLTVPNASQTGHWGGHRKKKKTYGILNSFILPVARQPPEVRVNPGYEQALRALTDNHMGRILSGPGNLVLKRHFSVIKTNIRDTDAWEIYFTQWQPTAILCKTP